MKYGTIGLLLAFAMLLTSCMGPMWWPWRRAPLPGTYESNGEQIYFTATSQSPTPITFTMVGGGIPRMHRMGGDMACVDCHGPDGRGGTVQMMMMDSFAAPDVRYSTLTAGAAEHAQEGEETDGNGDEGHPPYTDATIRLAILAGVDPAGEPLNWPMPRWSMSAEDLEDLIQFLKTLD
jgi:cytochrome c oxidase subunit II